MTFYAEERAVSPVLGGILIFGLAMSLLILVQVSIVPASNTQVEFEHNQRVQDDFERFQGSASRVAASGAPETVDLEVGVRYPNRLFLVNPPPVSGQLTTEDATVSIANVQAINPETNDYFTGTKGNTLEYETHRLLYEPNYNEYTNAPRTVFENGVTFSEYDGDVTLVTSTTPLVNDREITLVLLDGDVYEEGTSSASLSLQAASAPSQRLAITNTSTGPIEITLNTRLPASEWQAFDDATPAVTNVAFAGDEVTLTLDPSSNYTLRIARLTIGDDAVAGTAAYVTGVGEYASSIPPNSGITYTVEVRDEQNNPVTGGDVTATITKDAAFVGDATFSNGQPTQTVSVDEDGRATVVVTGNQNARGAIDVSIGRDTTGTNGLSDESADQVVDHTLTFVPTEITEIDEVADVGGNLNPNDATTGSLTLQNTTVLGSGDARLEFEKLGAGSKNVSEIRVTFVSLDGQGRSPVDKFDQVDLLTVNNGGTPYPTRYDTTFTIGDGYKPVTNAPIVVQSGDVLTMDLQFSGISERGSQAGTRQTYDLQAGDFFIVSMTFEDGTTATYFAGISS